MNPNVKLLSTDFKLPSGWTPAQTEPGGRWGTFPWEVSHLGTGATLLKFDIDHKGIKISDFQFANIQGSQFAAQIIGFTTNPQTVTSQWVSNAAQVPEPFFDSLVSVRNAFDPTSVFMIGRRVCLHLATWTRKRASPSVAL